MATFALCVAAKDRGNVAFSSGDMELAITQYTLAISEWERALRSLPPTADLEHSDRVRYDTELYGFVTAAYPILREYSLRSATTEEVLWRDGALRRFAREELQLVPPEPFSLRLACLQNLAAACLKQGDFSAAVSWADAALQMDRRARKALMRKGAALLRLAEAARRPELAQQAEIALQRAMELHDGEESAADPALKRLLLQAQSLGADAPPPAHFAPRALRMRAAYGACACGDAEACDSSCFTRPGKTPTRSRVPRRSNIPAAVPAVVPVEEQPPSVSSTAPAPVSASRPDAFGEFFSLASPRAVALDAELREKHGDSQVPLVHRKAFVMLLEKFDLLDRLATALASGKPDAVLADLWQRCAALGDRGLHFMRLACDRGEEDPLKLLETRLCETLQHFPSPSGASQRFSGAILANDGQRDVASPSLPGPSQLEEAPGPEHVTEDSWHTSRPASQMAVLQESAVRSIARGVSPGKLAGPLPEDEQNAHSNLPGEATQLLELEREDLKDEPLETDLQEAEDDAVEGEDGSLDHTIGLCLLLFIVGLLIVAGAYRVSLGRHAAPMAARSEF